MEVERYLYFHDKFIYVFLDRFGLDRDLRRLLDHVRTAEPRDFRLGIRFALALHGDQRTGLVRDNARFLDEGRSATRALLCILERSTVRRRRRRYKRRFRDTGSAIFTAVAGLRRPATATHDDVSHVVGSSMSYEAKIQRLHDWLAIARLCLPDKPTYDRNRVHREKCTLVHLYRAFIECITYDGNMGKVDSSWTKSTRGISLSEQFAAFRLISNKMWNKKKYGVAAFIFLKLVRL